MYLDKRSLLPAKQNWVFGFLREIGGKRRLIPVLFELFHCSLFLYISKQTKCHLRSSWARVVFFSNVGSDSLCMFREIMDFKYFMGCLFFKKEIHDFSIGLC